jgi:hypothetical protein
MASPLPFDPADAQRNILRMYREATPDQLLRGATWYPDAHTFALALDPTDVHRAAGVIAALSPRTHWAENVKYASRAYVEGFASGTLSASCRAADRILSGERWQDVLKGPKTRAFAWTIADPTDAVAVVVDRHALSVALAHPADDRTAQRILGRLGGYDAVASAYIDASDVTGILPSTIQATTWIVWREGHIRTSAAERRRALLGNVPA